MWWAQESEEGSWKEGETIGQTARLLPDVRRILAIDLPNHEFPKSLQPLLDSPPGYTRLELITGNIEHSMTLAAPSAAGPLYNW